MKKRKKILLFVLGFFIITLAIGILYLDKKKDKIIPYIVQSINSQIEGEFKYESISLIPFKHFPAVSISIEKPILLVKIESRIDTVIQLNEIDLSFDVLGLLRSEINLSKLSIYGGKIQIVQYPDSTFNITNALRGKEVQMDSSKSKKAVNLNIDKLFVENVDLEFYHLNHNAHLNTSINSIKASFQFSKDSLNCTLDLHSKLNEFVIGNDRLIEDKKISLNSSFNYNNITKSIRIKKGKLGISEALILLDGEIELLAEKNIHLNFEADDKNLQFTKLFFTKEEKNLIESGSLFLKGTINGSLNDELPSTKLSFGAKNLTLNIPGSSNQIKNLDFEADFYSGEKKDLSEAILKIESIQSELPNGHLKGNMSISNFSNPYLDYDLDLKTKLDGFDNLLKDTSIDSLSGLISVNNRFIGYLYKKEWNKEDSINTMEAQINDLSFSINNEFIFKNITSNFTTNDGVIFLDTSSLTLNNSSIVFIGKIENYLALMLDLESPAIADLTLSTKLYDFPDFFSYSNSIASSFPYKIEDITMSLKVITSLKDLSHFSSVPKMDFQFHYLHGKIDELCAPVEIKKGVFKMGDKSDSATFDFDNFSLTVGVNPIDLDLFYAFSENKRDSIYISALVKDFNVGENVYLESLSFLNDTSQLIVDGALNTQISWDNDSTTFLTSISLEVDDVKYSTDTTIISCSKLKATGNDLKDINNGNYPFSTLNGILKLDFGHLYTPFHSSDNIVFDLIIVDGQYKITANYLFEPIKNKKLQLTCRPFDSIPNYHIIYQLNQTPVTELFTNDIKETIFEGDIDLNIDLSFSGNSGKEILRTMTGHILLKGDSLFIQGFDIDKLITKFKRSQNFNLVDIGAVLVAGPIGLLYSKGSDYAFMFVGVKGDSSTINQIYSSWDVENGLFTTRDFAAATGENRVAFDGWINLANDSLDLTMALIDEYGCSIVSQSLKGSIDNPQAGKVKVVKTVLAPVSNLVNNVFQVDCDIIYNGKVKAVNKDIDSKTEVNK